MLKCDKSKRTIVSIIHIFFIAIILSSCLNLSNKSLSTSDIDNLVRITQEAFDTDLPNDFYMYCNYLDNEYVYTKINESLLVASRTNQKENYYLNGQQYTYNITEDKKMLDSVSDLKYEDIDKIYKTINERIKSVFFAFNNNMSGLISKNWPYNKYSYLNCYYIYREIPLNKMSSELFKNSETYNLVNIFKPDLTPLVLHCYYSDTDFNYRNGFFIDYTCRWSSNTELSIWGNLPDEIVNILDSQSIPSTK